MSDLGDVVIGGKVRDRHISEALSLLPMNKTLIIQQLTDEPEARPDITEGLDNIGKVFDTFKPNINVEFENKEGAEIKENIQFKNVGDFGAKGLLKQSKFLNDLDSEKEELFKFMKTLKSNKPLQKILNDPEQKQAYIATLKGVLKELQNKE